MKCLSCKGTGKVEYEYVTPESQENGEEKCWECKGTGERNIVLTVVLWDEDNEREIISETVQPTYEHGAEAVARLTKYTQEN
jgi:hypothetical protein